MTVDVYLFKMEVVAGITKINSSLLTHKRFSYHIKHHTKHHIKAMDHITLRIQYFIHLNINIFIKPKVDRTKHLTNFERNILAQADQYLNLLSRTTKFTVLQFKIN